MAKSVAQRAARRRRRQAKQQRANMKGPKLTAPARKRKQNNKKSKMKGAGPRNVSANTGRLGLSMSSGYAGGNGVTNRRQKVCEEDEFIANVTGSSTTSAFTISNMIACNPGQSPSFPWLSLEAPQYNEYDFEYLEYYFKRTVSEFATAGTQGKVLLFFNPDATDGPPTTKQQIEDSVYHNDGMPCDPIIKLVVDTQRLRKNDAKFVRVGAQPANTDLKTYDVGTLICATDSTATSGVIGELRVRYRVKFTVPILLPSATIAGGVIHFSGIIPTTANNFATAVLQSGGTPSMTGITLGVNTIVFPANIPGNYYISMAVGGTSATTLNASGGTALNLITQGGARNLNDIAITANATTPVDSMLMFTVTIGQTGGTITITPSTIVGGANMDLFIVGLPVTVLTVDEKEQLEIDELKEQVAHQERRFNELIARLEMNLLPAKSAFSIGLKKLDDGECKEECDDSPAESGDELSKSVHIPRNILSKYIKK